MNASTGDADVYEAPATARRMLVATWALLYSLGPALRTAAEFPMDAPQRLDWDFIPKPDRAGVPVAVMDQQQRLLAHNLLAEGLSLEGYAQALEIMAMENILRVRDQPRLGLSAAGFRHSEHYFFSFFGRPGFEETWGWRILGHHLSVSYTIIDQRWVTVTPFNVGAEPAYAGQLAPLRLEENLAFSFLRSLDPQLRAEAVIHPVAPADYVTRQVPRVGEFELPDYYDLGIPSYQITDGDRQALKFVRDEPRGVSGGKLTADQAAILLSLVACYTNRLPAEIARRHFESIEKAGTGSLHFCWAGQQEMRTPHYFRIQSPRFLIEFDNAVDNGNHVHSIWRDLANDLGGDLLADHYERAREGRHHLASRLISSAQA